MSDDSLPAGADDHGHRERDRKHDQRVNASGRVGSNNVWTLYADADAHEHSQVPPQVDL